MPGALRGEMASNQRRRCCPRASAFQVAPVDSRGLLDLLFVAPCDRLACFMNAARKNGLSSLVAAANSQFKNHLLFAIFALVSNELELNRGGVFGSPKIGLIEPMTARLGSPA